jgi:hypothetical protein
MFENCVCKGRRWVCERHPDQPFGPPHNTADQASCGGAGTPCPICNQPELASRPDMGPDFTPDMDVDKGALH